MNQSTFIAGALLAGFVLWLAANNRLASYTAVLWGNTAAATPTGGAQDAPASIGGGSSGGGTAKTVLSLANLAANIFGG